MRRREAVRYPLTIQGWVREIPPAVRILVGLVVLGALAIAGAAIGAVLAWLGA